MPDSAVILEELDWEGTMVRLHEKQWGHIQRRHPEMTDALDAIRLAISDPDVVTRSDTLACHPDGERRVNSRRATHPRYRALYVRVPIEYCPTGNWVTTAYVNPLPPEGDLVHVRI